MKGRETVQVDLFILPNPVIEKGEKGYFPRVLLILDKANGMVLGMNMLTPVPDLVALYGSVPQKLLEEISKLGYRPAKLEFRSDLLYGLTEGVLRKQPVHELMYLCFTKNLNQNLLDLQKKYYAY